MASLGSQPFVIWQRAQSTTAIRGTLPQADCKTHDSHKTDVMGMTTRTKLQFRTTKEETIKTATRNHNGSRLLCTCCQDDDLKHIHWQEGQDEAESLLESFASPVGSLIH